jgi:hypothetical protein
MTELNSGNFKKGSAMETYKGSPAKQLLFKKVLVKKDNFQGGVLQKNNFQGSFWKRATFKNDPDNCCFEIGSKKRQHSRKALQRGLFQGRSS